MRRNNEQSEDFEKRRSLILVNAFDRSWRFRKKVPPVAGKVPRSEIATQDFRRFCSQVYPSTTPTEQIFVRLSTRSLHHSDQYIAPARKLTGNHQVQSSERAKWATQRSRHPSGDWSRLAVSCSSAEDNTQPSWLLFSRSSTTREYASLTWTEALRCTYTGPRSWLKVHPRKPIQ